MKTQIRLVDAKLCSDCDTIFDEEQTRSCPKCTSEQSLKLSSIIPAFETKITRPNKNIDISQSKC